MSHHILCYPPHLHSPACQHISCYPSHLQWAKTSLVTHHISNELPHLLLPTTYLASHHISCYPSHLQWAKTSPVTHYISSEPTHLMLPITSPVSQNISCYPTSAVSKNISCYPSHLPWGITTLIIRHLSNELSIPFPNTHLYNDYYSTRQPAVLHLLCILLTSLGTIYFWLCYISFRSICCCCCCYTTVHK